MKKINLLLVISLVGIIFTTACSSEESSDISIAKNNLEKTKSGAKLILDAEVTKRNFKVESNLSGVIAPSKEVIVTAKVSGSIEDVLVEVGDSVEKDQLLLKIDDETHKIQYEKGLSGLENSKLLLNRLTKYSVKKDTNFPAIENAIAAYKASKITLDNSKDNLESAVEDYEKIQISSEIYEKIQEAHELAKIDYDRALTNLEQAKKNWEYDVQGAKIALEVAKSDVEMLKMNLDNTKIKSPLKGIVSSKIYSEGENVSPGRELFKIINIDKVYFESGVSEFELGSIYKGLEVEIFVESLSEKRYKGVITSISPTFDDKSKTFPFKVKVNNPELKLKSGMFATVHFPLNEKTEVLSVPKKAIKIEKDISYVYINDNGIALKREVVTGFEDEKYIEILKGVNEKEKVIIEGLDKIVSGDLVKSQ